MKKNELVRITIEYDHVKEDFDVARQTVFISKEEFEKKKSVPIKIRKQSVKSIKVEIASK